MLHIFFFFLSYLSKSLLSMIVRNFVPQIHSSSNLLIKHLSPCWPCSLLLQNHILQPITPNEIFVILRIILFKSYGKIEIIFHK